MQSSLNLVCLNCSEQLWHKFCYLHTVTFFNQVFHEINNVLKFVVQESIRFNLVNTVCYLAEHSSYSVQNQFKCLLKLLNFVRSIIN